LRVRCGARIAFGRFAMRANESGGTGFAVLRLTRSI
jgi:hypothetical protein